MRFHFCIFVYLKVARVLSGSVILVWFKTTLFTGIGYTYRLLGVIRV